MKVMMYYETIKLINFIDYVELTGGKVNRSSKIIDHLKVGDKIHIKSRSGMYEVTKLTETGFVITCETWKKKYESKQQDFKTKHVFFSDFKCLAGGTHNLHRN